MIDNAEAASFCTLNKEQLAERIAMIRREVLPHALAKQVLPDGRAWTFDRTLRTKLEQLVALERECCRDGVTFALEEHASQLRLEIRGVDPNAAVFQSLETPPE
jgi:hypothetical protein